MVNHFLECMIRVIASWTEHLVSTENVEIPIGHQRPSQTNAELKPCSQNPPHALAKEWDDWLVGIMTVEIQAKLLHCWAQLLCPETEHMHVGILKLSGRRRSSGRRGTMRR